MSRKAPLCAEVLDQEARRMVPSLLEHARVPGLSAAIVQGGGTLWSAAYGLKDSTTRAAVGGETVFEAGSLSKPLFAYGVLVLCAQGEMDLDTPLRCYVPAPYVADDPGIDRITARMVLSHVTGLPNWRSAGEPLRVLRAPGASFGYSGEGYVYLQRVVEHLVGEPLEDYMQRAVLAPLGMAASSYVWLPRYEETAARGHHATGEPVETWKPEEANAAGSLHTTPLDYARFLVAMTVPDRGRAPLDEAGIRAMVTPQIRLNRHLSWGLGWGLQETAEGQTFWHWGDIQGFKAFTLAYPATGTGIVIMTNGENGLGVCEQVVSAGLGGDYPAFVMLGSLGRYLL